MTACFERAEEPIDHRMACDLVVIIVIGVARSEEKKLCALENRRGAHHDA